MANGEQNPTNALLLGRVTVSGDLALAGKLSSAMFGS
jgi:putative sterol carrier protein